MITQRSREALDTLRQTTAEEKNEIVQTILNEYHDLEDVLLSSFRDIMSEKPAGKVKQFARKGGQKIKFVAKTVNDSVSCQPWPYLAGLAAGAGAIGYLLGRRR